MTDLRLEREFPVSPEKLFDWISSPGKLLKWWGSEGMHLSAYNLDLSRTGPWYSVLKNDEGQQYKMSGHVTHVDPPKSVGFTWGWHDPEDNRGAESHVTFTVVATATGSRLLIDHRDLGDDEISTNHERGWSSALRKLSAHLS